VGEGLGESGLGAAELGEDGLGEAGLGEDGLGEGFGEGVDGSDFLSPTKAS